MATTIDTTIPSGTGNTQRSPDNAQMIKPMQHALAGLVQGILTVTESVLANAGLEIVTPIHEYAKKMHTSMAEIQKWLYATVKTGGKAKQQGA